MTLQAPCYADGSVTIYHGDALTLMESMPEGSIQTVCTSPPYWGLRRYQGEQERAWADGVTCAFGHESTPALYVAHTVEVLRAIRRVLREDGLVWWNVGDSYAGSGKGLYGDGTAHGTEGRKQKTNAGSIGLPSNESGLAQKNLCLIPQRVAIAAQEDGWYVRSIIIWAKPNPMPESVRDRCTTAHEYILMLAKSERYYYDAEAVREPNSPTSTVYGPSHSTKVNVDTLSNGRRQTGLGPRSYEDRLAQTMNGRNLRSVWAIASEPFKGAHFAVFPPELPRRCILAATSEAGNCSKCGKPWERKLERKAMVIRRTDWGKQAGNRTASSGTMVSPAQAVAVGWRPACECEVPSVPAIVLDCFAGSGTTGAVAKSLGRQAILIDRSEQYCAMAARRVQAVSMPMRMAAGS